MCDVTTFKLVLKLKYLMMAFADIMLKFDSFQLEYANTINTLKVFPISCLTNFYDSTAAQHTASNEMKKTSLERYSRLESCGIAAIHSYI